MRANDVGGSGNYSGNTAMINHQDQLESKDGQLPQQKQIGKSSGPVKQKSKKQ